MSRGTEVNSEADTIPATAHDHGRSSQPQDPLVGTMIGSYRVEALLGQGGMGSVYRAVHPRIGTEVAIKVLHASLARSVTVMERFEREARASGAIGSPYIPKFYDFGSLDDGCSYAVLDFYEGESVADRLERGPIEVELVQTLLMQAARALGDAHRQGIIHRDVKPDNLFIVRDADGEESVRVLDFGIAKVTHDEDLTLAGVFLGTPHYCAPEQLRGKDPEPSMDIYALGATAFEMLTGQPPFADTDLRTLIRRKAEGEVPSSEPLAKLPVAVRQTVLRAIEFEPAARHGTMAELEDAVAAWSPSRAKRPLWPIAALLLVVLAFAVTAWVMHSDGPTTTPLTTAPVSDPELRVVDMQVEPAMVEPAMVEPAMVEPATLEPAIAMAEPAMVDARPRMRPPRMREQMSTSMAEMTDMTEMRDDWVDWESQ